MPDVLNDKAFRDYFFEGPMEQFLVLREGTTPSRRTRTTPLPRIHAEEIMVKCADSIFNYIKKVADDVRSAVSLAYLELYNAPKDRLSTWISRLSTLRALRIRDGSILGAEAAGAISQYCPHFDELTLYWLDGPTVDEDLATFFNTIRPNSLRSFEIISQNRIGKETLTALNTHALSLKILKLGNLTAQGLRSMSALPNCTALEVLEIENDGTSQVSLREAATWIRSCKSLNKLGLYGCWDSMVILKEVLTCPDIRLNSLAVRFLRQFDDQESDAAWAALKQQNDLESLALGARLDHQEMFTLAEWPNLIDSICSLKKLKSLDLKQTWAQAQEISLIAKSLPELVDFTFGGQLVDDSILQSLAVLPHLTTVSINAHSAFTMHGLQRFARSLQRDMRRGFQLEILSQAAEPSYHRLRAQDESILHDIFASKLGGKFEIGYYMDPDELHEDDFESD